MIYVWACRVYEQEGAAETKKAAIVRTGAILALLTAFVSGCQPQCAPTPPASGKIAFVSDRDDNCEIYVMDSDGSNLCNVTNSPASDGAPTWSPDRSRIAFSSDREGNLEVYVMDSDGSNLTRLTNNLAVDGLPAWSPDGTRIAFSSDRNGDFEIYIMDTDGSNARNVTNNPAADGLPDW